MLRALSFEGSKVISENESNGKPAETTQQPVTPDLSDEQKEDNGSEPATTTLQQKTSDHMEYLPSPKYP